MVQSQTTWYVLKEKSKSSIKTYSTTRRTEKISVKIHALILYRKKTIKIMVYYARHHEYYYHMIKSHQQFQNFIHVYACKVSHLQIFSPQTAV